MFAEANVSRVQVFHLEHRVATEMVPVLRPMLGSSDALSATNSQLVVRANAETLLAIAALVEQLDVAPRKLQLSVQRTTGRLPDDTTNSHRRRYNASRESIQQLRGVEGVPMLLHQREDTLFVQQIGRENIALGTQPIHNALQFVVRIYDSTATVDVYVQSGDRSRHGGGAVEHSELSTRLAGPLGQWLTVASDSPSSKKPERRVLTAGGTTQQYQLANLHIRVDVLP